MSPIWIIATLLAIALIATGIYHRYKPLPGGLSNASAWFPAENPVSWSITGTWTNAADPAYTAPLPPLCSR